MTDENVNKVPKGQWKKWSPQARRVFNSVFEMMNENQNIFLHPMTHPIGDVAWKTTAWNASWIAADSVMKA